MARTLCSFCGKPEESVKSLVVGPDDVAICNECVQLCLHVQQAGFGATHDLLLTAIGELVTNDPFVAGLTGTISDAAVAIKGGVVSWAGPEMALPNRYRDLPTQSCEGRAVMPAFIDADTQILFGGEQGEAYRNLRVGNEADHYAFSQSATHLSRLATAATPDHLLASEVSVRLQRLINHGTTTVVAGSHFGCDPASQKRMIELAVDLDAQSAMDVISCAVLGDPHNDLPTADYAELMGDFDLSKISPAVEQGMSIRFRPGKGTFATSIFEEFEVHSLLLDNHNTTYEVLDEIAESGGVAVITPTLEREGFSARMAWDRGVTVAIATGCDPLDRYVESMQLAVAAAVRNWNLSIDEAVWSATRGPALAIDAGEKGWIGRGSVADLIVLDAPSSSHLAYRMGVNLVWQTIKQGRVVSAEPRAAS